MHPAKGEMVHYTAEDGMSGGGYIKYTPMEEASNLIEDLVRSARVCYAELTGTPCILDQSDPKNAMILSQEGLTVREFQLICESDVVEYVTEEALFNPNLAPVPDFHRVAGLLCAALQLARYPALGGIVIPTNHNDTLHGMEAAIDVGRKWLKESGQPYEDDLSVFDWIAKNPEY